MMDNFKITFDNARESKKEDLYFVFFKGNILVKKQGDSVHVPNFSDIEKLGINYEHSFFIGELDGKACFTFRIETEFNHSEELQLIPMRDFARLMSEELFLIAGRGSQIINWDKTHSFCGRCGAKTENKKDEMAKLCPECGNVMYPVICPAIIVAVIKEGKILLAHNGNFKNDMYGLVAGFVEAGEDLESAVKREVFEEIGINIKNVEYFKSSPWPFPNSLMLGFFAEYASGEIKVDGREIVHADWFSKNEFPNIPEKFSLARRLIDEFAKA
ncbi:NAD(+) diphosphatase [Clostridium sp. 19966]|uniref:NAD(+) diphosphatase n=1 Tax=Clostridium sp. 19966 TaxID=2768166 RepID=UPI0028DF96E6|nr:NAD(+) diphosphatase [Clostridium sp. 19966]MDT8716946.1 NAD(+) diphosphatase [Clostridium sp. 19966]